MEAWMAVLTLHAAVVDLRARAIEQQIRLQRSACSNTHRERAQKWGQTQSGSTQRFHNLSRL